MKNEVQKFVGKKGIIKLNGLAIEVNITDFKNSYGRDRYQVTPVAGKGLIWVEKIELK